MQKRNTHAHAITQHTQNTRKHTHPCADGAGGVREVAAEARKEKGRRGERRRRTNSLQRSA